MSTVAQSRAYDLLRKEGRARPDADIQTTIDHAISSYVEEVYLADDLLKRIRSELSPSDRELLDQVLWGNAAPEIAMRFAISVPTARVRLHRLRMRIGSLLSRFENSDERNP